MRSARFASLAILSKADVPSPHHALSGTRIPRSFHCKTHPPRSLTRYISGAYARGSPESSVCSIANRSEERAAALCRQLHHGRDVGQVGTELGAAGK